MPLFQCQTCGAVENTALGEYWLADVKQCSQCATGEWHDQFPKKDAAAEGYFFDANGYIYGPNEVDQKKMVWTYNRSFKMKGRCQPIVKKKQEPEPITHPCEWVCPHCHQMETDELARDTHECDPELLDNPR